MLSLVRPSTNPVFNQQLFGSTFYKQLRLNEEKQKAKYLSKSFTNNKRRKLFRSTLPVMSSSDESGQFILTLTPYPLPRELTVVYIAKILKYFCIAYDITIVVNLRSSPLYQKFITNVPWSVHLPQPYRFPHFEIIEPEFSND